MNILIVDDEYLVIEEIVSSVNWDRLDITGIFTAGSLKQALTILKQQPVDLVLCDIEMPGGNGLELLRTIKRDHPGIEVLLLTCHAKFSYAREAIRLGSLEYLLKPISFPELENSLQRAIDKIRQTEQFQEARRYGSYWQKHLPVMIERFWFDIVTRSIEANASTIQRISKQRNIPFDSQLRFLPILIVVRRWHVNLKSQDEKLRLFLLKSTAIETIITEEARGLIIDFSEKNLIVLISDFSNSTSEMVAIERDCERFIASCHQYLECDLNCYIGQASLAQDMAEQIEKLVADDEKNVTFDNQVISDVATAAKGQLVLPDMMVWSVLLSNGRHRQVMNEAIRFLSNHIQSKTMDSESLNRFYQDFMQIIFTFLKTKNIQPSQLFCDEDSILLVEQATQSVSDMVRWISWMDGTIHKFISQNSREMTLADQVAHYIQQNLDRDLTREEIAASFFFHPDSLNRLFKKDTGMSITKYLTEIRLQNACKLLTDTSLSVSLIAMSSGFRHLSYFSSIFKRTFGMTPVEYRRTKAGKRVDVDKK
ncbi:MAG: response regulator transcription factor [Saccharofermentanales bacterium]|jgi:two-component system response regulator YesN